MVTAHCAFRGKECTRTVTDTTGQGVRITNLGLDLGWRGAVASLASALGSQGVLLLSSR